MVCKIASGTGNIDGIKLAVPSTNDNADDQGPQRSCIWKSPDCKELLGTRISLLSVRFS
jgi:hypothetical protein